MAINTTNLETHVQSDINALTGSEAPKDILKVAVEAKGLPVDTTNLVAAINTAIAATTGVTPESDLIALNAARIAVEGVNVGLNTGDIIATELDVLPDGTELLPCDRTEVDSVTYPDLHAVLEESVKVTSIPFRINLHANGNTKYLVPVSDLITIAGDGNDGTYTPKLQKRTRANRFTTNTTSTALTSSGNMSDSFPYVSSSDDGQVIGCIIYLTSTSRFYLYISNNGGSTFTNLGNTLYGSGYNQVHVSPDGNTVTIFDITADNVNAARIRRIDNARSDLTVDYTVNLSALMTESLYAGAAQITSHAPQFYGQDGLTCIIPMVRLSDNSYVTVKTTDGFATYELLVSSDPAGIDAYNYEFSELDSNVWYSNPSDTSTPLVTFDGGATWVEVLDLYRQPDWVTEGMPSDTVMFGSVTTQYIGRFVLQIYYAETRYYTGGNDKYKHYVYALKYINEDGSVEDLGEIGRDTANVSVSGGSASTYPQSFFFRKNYADGNVYFAATKVGTIQTDVFGKLTLGRFTPNKPNAKIVAKLGS